MAGWWWTSPLNVQRERKLISFLSILETGSTRLTEPLCTVPWLRLRTISMPVASSMPKKCSGNSDPCDSATGSLHSEGSRTRPAPQEVVAGELKPP